MEWIRIIRYTLLLCSPSGKSIKATVLAVCMVEEEQRGRGILTPIDREYLLGNKTYQDDQQEINRRSSIRQRVQDSIVDFSILFKHLSSRDRKQIFGDIKSKKQSSNQLYFKLDPKPRADNTDLENGIIDGFGFFYLGCEDADMNFERTLESGINRAEKNIIVNISIQEPDDLVDSAAKKLLDNDPLSSEEAQAIAQRLDEDSSKTEPVKSIDYTTDDHQNES